jgi:hypothetical protein
MSKFPVQDDLLQFSTTANSDEERLLVLYRQCSFEERTELLYRITRLKIADWFTGRTGKVHFCDTDVDRPRELEESLKDIYPIEVLERLQISIHEPQLSSIWSDAWGEIAPVILGSTERDGHHADALYLSVRDYCQSQRRGDMSKFSRRDALELIETWRESALQILFTVSA